MDLSRREIIIILLLIQRLKKKNNDCRDKKHRRFWVRQLYMDREKKGEYHLLVNEKKRYDKEYFFQNF